MPAYSDRTRSLARGAGEAADWTADVTTVIALGVAASGDDDRGAILLFVAGGFKLVARVSEKMADDPPRDDFHRATTLEPASFKVRSRVLKDRVAATSWDTAHTSERAAAHLRAGLLAFERWQGAQKGLAEAASDRASEAERFTRRGGLLLVSTAELLSDLAADFADAYGIQENSLLRAGEAALSRPKTPHGRIMDLSRLVGDGLTPEATRQMLRDARSTNAGQYSHQAWELASDSIAKYGRHLSDWKVTEASTVA